MLYSRAEEGLSCLNAVHQMPLNHNVSKCLVDYLGVSEALVKREEKSKTKHPDIPI